MFGPIDTDSLDFQTRLQIVQISELTGETRSAAVARAVEECYRRTIATTSDEALSARKRTWLRPANRLADVSVSETPSASADGMPEISRFYGIVIRMFDERGERHHLPHFHAAYGEWTATLAIDSLAILSGNLPGPQRRLVEAWAEIHRAELLENWGLLISGQQPFKIDPLT